MRPATESQGLPHDTLGTAVPHWGGGLLCSPWCRRGTVPGAGPLARDICTLPRPTTVQEWPLPRGQELPEASWHLLMPRLGGMQPPPPSTARQRKGPSDHVNATTHPRKESVT